MGGDYHMGGIDPTCGVDPMGCSNVIGCSHAMGGGDPVGGWDPAGSGDPISFSGFICAPVLAPRPGWASCHADCAACTGTVAGDAAAAEPDDEACFEEWRQGAFEAPHGLEWVRASPR